MSKCVIGIVGGIGCGKSAISRGFHDRGATLIDADRIAHAAHGDPLVREMIFSRWPIVRNDDDTVNRRNLGAIVFADVMELRVLESMVFPWINAEIRRQLSESAANSQALWTVLDAAIMLETGWSHVCDQILFVHAPRAIRAERVRSRGWTAAELNRRERMQWPLTRKAAVASGAIDNSGSLNDLEPQLAAWMREWNLPETRHSLGVQSE